MDDDLNLGQAVALIIPLALVQLGLLAFALHDLARRKRVKGGNKWLWGIVLLMGIVGPILYFVLGREEE